MKKVAFVHDRLVFLWGADKVFFQLIEDEKNYDDATIFTLISKYKHLDIAWKKITIITALPHRINNWFIYRSTDKKKFTNYFSRQFSRVRNYRNLIVFFPILLQLLSYKIRKYNPQKIIISSANVSKNINVPWVYKKLYIHSPIMYVQKEFKKFFEKFNYPTRVLLYIITPYIRKRDKKFTTFDEVRSNSFHTAKLVKQTYKIESKVAYPIVPEKELYFQQKVAKKIDDYYIYVGRLVNTLRDVDKIIHLCNQTQTKLIIIWSWADEEHLHSIAWETIHFMWYISDRKKIISLVKKSKGYINLAYESSWMSTVEAMLLGVPILWYNKWGTAELVDKKSWYLVNKKDMKSLIEWFNKFCSNSYDRHYIQKNIQQRIEKFWRHTM